MTLRQHMKERHSNRAVHFARSNEDLAKQHAREHYRMRLDHNHGPTASDDNTGQLVGPNSNLRRPAGWYTGENVIENS